MDRVDRYVFSAPVPYFFISLSLFTLILMVQQAAKLAELISSSQFPFEVTLRLLLLVIPGVLLFTVPMAAIVGTAVGYSRLLNDSELTALSAGGVSTARCLRPALLGGLLLLGFSLYTGFVLIPATARQLRETASEVVLERLSSPVEPKSFFTGFPGKVIYVQSGDREDGTWKNIFIHWKVEEGGKRLITAEGGRLNTSEVGIELYLRQAVITSIDEKNQITTEKATELHLRDERLDQYRASFAEKLKNRELSNEELSWRELSDKSNKAASVQERGEALAALHKRLALAVSPLILILVGALSVLRVRKGGKLSGISISVVLMLAYYLLFLVGEQLTRAAILPPAVGLWATPFSFSLLACALLLSRQGGRKGSGGGSAAVIRVGSSFKFGATKGTSVGLFDRYVLRSLAGLFLGILTTLNLIFLLFTLFELLKFISRNNIEAKTIFTYLLYLTPYSALILIPPCTFFAVLIGYALMVRRSEGVIWLSTGLSVPRIVVPAIFFSVLVGLGAYFLQNEVSPAANKRQNELRRYIRSGERTLAAQNGGTWVSVPEEGRIYLFDAAGKASGRQQERVAFYEFDESGIHLRRIFESTDPEEPAVNPRSLTGKAYDFGVGGPRFEPLAEVGSPPRHIRPLNADDVLPETLSAKELSVNLRLLKTGEAETAPFTVELQRRRAALVAPLILALIAAPFAFLKPRQNLTNGIYQAVALMLLFLVLSRVCQTLGAGGYLPPVLSVWAVPVLFSSFGLYLLTRART
ncbi:MAG TPA: LptF/LptG family permease [Pyrinomonadaceae bacterium]|nr:LptF/LptG family permease [Pyrinomonadaceae bacterium]